ncbi:MAG TPA: hypothetical protein PKM73_15205 [Verrucomicrobiota bacterium]|nr:hypothetical protein [Verrucomicrobiota bacterium]HNU52676.1 hypothetical protein [Verrucomicrobiota bacterium]
MNEIIHDVSRDFSGVTNPNGPWSYGWKSDAAGAFTLLSVHEVFTVENGVPVQLWWYGPRHNPMVGYNATTTTAIHDSGQAVMPPGTVWFEPGLDGEPQNFCVIRFTVPIDGGGTYLLESAVQCYLDGDRSGDTDYHVIVNGGEVFGQFLPPRTATGYTNVLNLSAGNTIDFMVGRGADNHAYGSGLKIQATLRQPAFCSPHRALATATVVNGFVVGATVIDGGCGYTNVNPPAVWILGGGGSGATAEAVVVDGVVTAIHVLDAGCCYTDTPKVVIASPPMEPTVSIEVSKVKVTQNVTLGLNYQLESSFDLVTWTAAGSQFTATSETIVSEFDVDVTGRYFRIRQVP